MRKFDYIRLQAFIAYNKWYYIHTRTVQRYELSHQIQVLSAEHFGLAITDGLFDESYLGESIPMKKELLVHSISSAGLMCALLKDGR